MPTEWFVIRGDKKAGPFDAAKLKELASTGKILPTDQVWKEGMAKPVAAEKVKGLFAVQAEATPEIIDAEVIEPAYHLSSPPAVAVIPVAEAITNETPPHSAANIGTLAEKYFNSAMDWVKVIAALIVVLAILVGITNRVLHFVGVSILGSSTSSMTKADFRNELRRIMSQGTVDNMRTYCICDYKKFINTFGEPDADQEFIEGQREWLYECADADVWLTVRAVPGKVIITKMEYR